MDDDWRAPTSHFPPGYTTRQAARVSGFVPPPLDGSIYGAEMVDWHLQHSENYPYAILVGESGEAAVEITWGEFARAVHRLSKSISDRIVDGPAKPSGKPKTVAILSAVDAFTYLTLLLSIMRAGMEPFPLSPRNSDDGLYHLISSVNVDYIVATPALPGAVKSAFQQTIDNVVTRFKASGHEVRLLPEPVYSDIYPRLAQSPPMQYDRTADIVATTLMPPLRSLGSYPKEVSDAWPSFILHSSGSTTFPKPIRIDHGGFIRTIHWPWYGDSDVGGTTFGALGLPGFHGAGVSFGLGVPMTCGATVVHFAPSDPPKAPTPDTTLQALKSVDLDWFMGIPAFLANWVHDAHAVEYLASRRAIVFGSAPMPLDVGDKLVAAGVNLVNVYGSTEVGVATRFSLEPHTEWTYTPFSTLCAHRLIPDDDANKSSRLVFLENPKCRFAPSVFNVEGERAYDTNDVVQEHPTKPGLYRIMGRADDQIMHSTGEKTNPGPLENIILGSPLLQNAVYFGRGKTQAGILVEPREPVEISKEAAIAQFRNAIWPYVERANKLAPSHSRVFKEYILVGDLLKKPFPRTPKGTVQRSHALRAYAGEIEKIYALASQSHDMGWLNPFLDAKPFDWLSFVRHIVNDVMSEKAGHDVEDDTDLFRQGCDSLQATLIRNDITAALRLIADRWSNRDVFRGSDPSAFIRQDLLYENPTIAALSHFVNNLFVGEVGQPKDVTSRTLAMEAMVQKYSQVWQLHTPTVSLERAGPATNLECVLITGTTGTLGCYLLARLLLDPTVKRVFALNRPRDSATVLSRQIEAFKDRGLDTHLVHNPKLTLLESHSSETDLGVSEAVFHEMRSSLTIIIHNAWHVDFKLSLSSFESLVQQTRDLVDLALSSERPEPPEVVFASTIGTVLKWNGDVHVPEDAIGPEAAIGTGYSEAKWVVDKMLQQASATTGLRTTSLRIGQLAGSRKNGAWNTTDWFPMIVRAGHLMGTLPHLGENDRISWLPVDLAAKSILEGACDQHTGHQILHVCHPHPTTWNHVLRPIAAHLGVKLVPYAQWYQALASFDNSSLVELQRNPALKIQDFLGQGSQPVGAFKEALNFPTLETKNMQRASPTLRELAPLDKKDVLNWLAYWKRHGLWS